LGEIIPITSLSLTILFSQYIYTKILNYTEKSKLKYIGGFVLSILLAFGVNLLKNDLPYFRFALMILVLTFFLSAILKTEIINSLISTIISTGISYFFSLISVMISTAFTIIIRSESNVILIASITVVLQSVFIILLFKIKRFKKGVTFLKNKGASAIGLIISGLLLLLNALVIRGIPAEIGVWAVLGIALCAAGLFVWWRHELTNQYRERVKERNAQELEKMILEKDLLIKKLKEDNEVMSGIIHRDNKLLPSLASKVELFMESEPHVSLVGRQILKQTKQLFEERTEVLNRCGYIGPAPQALLNPIIGGVLDYMMKRASEEDVQLEIAEINDTVESIESTISSIKLQTILADLIENAINATLQSDIKHIYVSFIVEDGVFGFNIQDSGIPFEVETLLELGNKKTTTRIKEGGSGIGYMTIFEILQEYKASLMITEYEPERSIFTKSITVRFDSMGKHILLTDRAEEIKKMRILAGYPEGPMKILPI